MDKTFPGHQSRVFSKAIIHKGPGRENILSYSIGYHHTIHTLVTRISNAITLYIFHYSIPMQWIDEINETMLSKTRLAGGLSSNSRPTLHPYQVFTGRPSLPFT